MSDQEQGTPEWLAARVGKATASKMHDITAKTKSGPSASRTNYAAKLVAERLTGTSEQGFVSAEMKWGTEHEAEARDAYAAKAGVFVVQVGFIDHPTIPMSGASPDGLVDDDGLVEIKCPNTATHIETLLGSEIDSKYIKQMQWQMACTGRQWCDFVSYDPRMPEHMRLHIRRVPRDNSDIAALQVDVKSFLSEVDATVIALSEKFRV